MLNIDEDMRSPHHTPSLSLSTLEEAQAFAEKIRERGFEYLRFEMSDMAGLSRGKTVPTSHVAAYMCSGLNITGVVVALDSGTNLVPGTGYSEERNFQDCVMVIDQATLSPVPWLEKTGRVICDPMWYDGCVQMASPRLLLKKILSVADARGYTVRMGA